MAYTTVLADWLPVSTSTSTPVNNKNFYEQPVGILNPAPISFSVLLINNVVTSTTVTVNIVYNPIHTPYNQTQIVSYSVLQKVSMTDGQTATYSFPFSSNAYNIIAVEYTTPKTATSGKFKAYLTTYS
jgi:hypothetical protein